MADQHSSKYSLRMDRPYVVVLGDAGNLGRHIVGRAIASGYRVLGVSRRSLSTEPLSPFHTHIERDVSLEPVRLAAEILDITEVPKTIIYNAGAFIDAPILKTTEEQLARLVAINFTSPYLLESELARAYQRRPYEENIDQNRSFINVSSAAIRPEILLTDKRDIAAYAATKAALATYSIAAAKEFIDFGVRVNVLAPTFFTGDTHRTERVAKLCIELAAGRQNGVVLE